MRVVKGRRRYIERMFRFWDFGDFLEEDATYVDSALRYYGTDTSILYGLRIWKARSLTCWLIRLSTRAWDHVTWVL